MRLPHLAVVGLGNVGSRVANACVELGMDVFGYDPFISVENAWSLNRAGQRVGTLQDLCRGCDYLPLPVPAKADTVGMISTDQLELLAPGAVLVNFARESSIDEDAVDAALRAGKLSWFACDFATPKTVRMPRTFITTHSGAVACDFATPKTVRMPRTFITTHSGAGTKEAEANCADMAISELKDYLENGNIAHSVNYPTCSMGKARAASRIGCLHANVPNMIGQITAVLAKDNANVQRMVNESAGDLHANVPNMIGQITAVLAKDNANVQRMVNESAGENAYTMFDTDEHLDEATIAALRTIPSCTQTCPT